MQIRVRNSLEFWKSTPTTAAVLFGIEMPYRPPRNPVGAFLWRRRVWLETTTGLSLLEPWEKFVIRKFTVAFAPPMSPDQVLQS